VVGQSANASNDRLIVENVQDERVVAFATLIHNYNVMVATANSDANRQTTTYLFSIVSTASLSEQGQRAAHRA
jgi:hypothetical protein